MKWLMILSTAFGSIRTALYHLYKHRSSITEFFLSYAMARVKVPSSETNLNLDLRQWAHKEATVLWKDKSVGVQRNAPHLKAGAGGSGQGSSGTLLFKGTSSWYPLWYYQRGRMGRSVILAELVVKVERMQLAQ